MSIYVNPCNSPSPPPVAALVFSEGGRSAGELYDEAALYTVESLWPNTSTAADVAEIAASFYYSSHARHDLNVLAEEMTEVGAGEDEYIVFDGNWMDGKKRDPALKDTWSLVHP